MGHFLPFNLAYKTQGGVEISAKSQAETFLDAALKLYDGGKGYQKVGLTYSANHDQTIKIKDTFDMGDWRTGTSGEHQAAVLHEAEALMETEKYKSLHGVVQWMPFTTMVGSEGKFEPKWVTDDINNLNQFMSDEGRILLGWQNQGTVTNEQKPFAIGGGVAEGLDDSKKASEKQLTSFQEELKKFQKEPQNKPKDETAQAMGKILEDHLKKTKAAAVEEKPQKKTNEKLPNEAELQRIAEEAETDRRKKERERWAKWRFETFDKKGKGKYWEKVDSPKEKTDELVPDVTFESEVYKSLEAGLYRYGGAVVRVEISEKGEVGVSPIDYKSLTGTQRAIAQLFGEKQPASFRETYGLALDLMRYQGAESVKPTYSSDKAIDFNELMTLMDLAKEKGLRLDFSHDSIQAFIAKNKSQGDQIMMKYKQVNDFVQDKQKIEAQQYKAQFPPTESGPEQKNESRLSPKPRN